MDTSAFYKKFLHIAPYYHQEEMFKLLWQIKDKTLFLLRAPTGSGKTESVVAPFLAQWVENQFNLAPRLIYVLPTRGLCNQIADRIKNYAKKVSEKLVVSIEHGANSSDPLFFADICVTTFDQFLYGYARTKPQIGRHVDIPAGSFANSVIVFDEAHLYSPYTHALLRALLEILHHSGIPTVMMTATMPETLRDDLLKGLSHQAVVYKAEKTNERNLSWKIEDWGLLENNLPSKDLLKVSKKFKGKKILIVANRVDVAQKLADGLREYNPVLIHSRFSVTDRQQREKEVLDVLGKEASRKEGLVISTQVCEVGLDISADILITEAASADAIVQRIGRVVRWGGEGSIIIVQPEKSVPYVDKKLGDAGDFVKVARAYLKEDRNLDFTSWDETTKFCNIMQYRIDNVEARNALGQLFEATLYADMLPYNLSARNDLYCTVFMTDAEDGDLLPYREVKGSFMNVPFRWLRHFWGKTDGKKNGIKIAHYDPQEQKLGIFSIDNRPKPFGIHALRSSDKHYDSKLGFSPKGETEEEETCMIF